MNTKQLKEILNKLKEDLDIQDKIKLTLKPMKTKAASISLKKNTIRINKNLISKLDLDSIEYLMLHELIHYKLKSTYHNNKFYELLKKKIDPEKIEQIERKILINLLKQNHIL
ncbi:MAG: M48 family metallopeptidase [archaeon GB-1845-036]|nr:M48 family metallopeptidase [Candidatus Culexmicrobium thermophilum]